MSMLSFTQVKICPFWSQERILLEYTCTGILKNQVDVLFIILIMICEVRCYSTHLNIYKQHTTHVM